MCQPYVVFEGQVAGTKARDMRLDAVYNSAMDKLMGTNGVPHSGHRADLWYEFVVTLQNGYCHPGGVLQVTFSGASAATAWARMTTSHVTDSSGFFHATFADDNGVFDGGAWDSVERSRVPVMRILQDSQLTRGVSVVGADKNIIAGSMHPSGQKAFFAQTGCERDPQPGGALLSLEVGSDEPFVRQIPQRWFTAATMDASGGEELLLGTVDRPATLLRVDSGTFAAPADADVSVIGDADGEVTFILQNGADGYVYMGVNSHPARIVRTAMNTSVSHLPTQTVTLAMDEIYPNCAARLPGEVMRVLRSPISAQHIQAITESMPRM